MIDRQQRLPVVQQRRILELSRSSVYYVPQPTSEAYQALMRQIVPALAARLTDHGTEPGLGHDHHLHPNAPGLCVLGRGPGLGDQTCLILTTIQQHDVGLLPIGP